MNTFNITYIHLCFMEKFNTFLEEKIGENLIYNTIYPYTYNSLPRDILLDIKNYVLLSEEIFKYYFVHRDYRRLYHDLDNFLESDKGFYDPDNMDGTTMPQFVNIYRRVYGKKNATRDQTRDMFVSWRKKCQAQITQIFDNKMRYRFYINNSELKSLLKKIIALMSIQERKWFIDNHVIYDAFFLHDEDRYLREGHPDGPIDGRDLEGYGRNILVPIVRYVPSYLQKENQSPDPFLDTGINKMPNCVVEGTDVSVFH